ncbi:flagellar hook-associated protein FlgK, partial [Carnobacterium jeotgali]|uniref:flagellar hook-associated protein FlgK n=1 Tax=Carnobacterium jeotgali TaxID=545534 RepID=UPI003C716465
MSGLFGTLNNATKGLLVQQSALQTTSHNISNANTEGYSRQKVTMVADNPYTLGGIGQLGTGVRIASIDRIVDPYVNNQLRNENSSLEMYSQKSDVLGQLEGIFNEPSTTGLNNNLSKVFASWTYLGSNPELATAKTMVAQNSETFTDTLHHMSNQIDNLHAGTVQDIKKNVLDFNSKVTQLDSLNQQIFNMTSQGQAPNDLLDQQDKILSELSGIAGVEAT